MIAVFTIPAMIAIALVFVYPVIRTILMSFFTIDNVVSKMSEWSFVGVSNYTQLLGTPLFRQTWSPLRRSGCSAASLSCASPCSLR